jgi:hypothetical protein
MRIVLEHSMITSIPAPAIPMIPKLNCDDVLKVLPGSRRQVPVRQKQLGD